MSEPTLSRLLIQSLIEIGHGEQFHLFDSLWSAPQQRDLGRIMRIRFGPWKALVPTLITDDLVALIKSLTVAERDLENWTAGSVSPVILLFKALRERDLALSEHLADWVLAHTENPYLPFGHLNLGATSLSGYFRSKEQANQRKRARQAAETERERIAKEKKAHRATYNLFRAIQRGDTKAVEALIRKGADVNAVNEASMSALLFARQTSKTEIIELLIAAGAKA